MSDAAQYSERNRLKAGDRVGDHLVVRSVLGQGGTAIVYEALHTRLGALVALKVLNVSAEFAHDGALRLQREAEVCASIDDPRIPRVYDVGALPDGTPYVVMEKVSGVTLEELLQAGPLATHAVLEITRELLKALEAVHRGGVVHRDIKPANVIVKTASDGTRQVRLMDFGVSKSVCRELDDVKLTRVGTVVGTPHYMAPEQITGEPTDARADVYATGVVMFEMLTGATPFNGESTAEIVAAVLRHEPPDLRALRPEVPPALAKLVTCAMAARPGERFLTARDFLSALEAAALDAPSLKLAAPVLERASEPSALTLMPPPRGFVAPEQARSLSPRRFSLLGAGLVVFVGTVGFPGAAHHDAGVEVARAHNEAHESSQGGQAVVTAKPFEGVAQAALEAEVAETADEPSPDEATSAEAAPEEGPLAEEAAQEGVAQELVPSVSADADVARSAARYRLKLPEPARLKLDTELVAEPLEEAQEVAAQPSPEEQQRAERRAAFLSEEERATERLARRRLREAEEQVRREDMEFERKEAERTGIVISDYLRKLEEIQRSARDESSALPARANDPLPDNPYYRD